MNLDTYACERDLFIDQLAARLRGDERVVAAWLSGAHGRCEEDEWSDLDLHIAVIDEAFEGIRSSPADLFSAMGTVLLIQAGFASDSVPGGWFWLVLYPGPIEVDWNVGPASQAARPEASRLLFDRANVPPPAESPPLPTKELVLRAQRQLEFFWAMAPIALKYAGRGWTRRAVQQEALLAGALEGLGRIVDGRPLRSADAYDQNRPMEPDIAARMPRFDVSIDACDVVRVVREYCMAVESLHPALLAMGATPPVDLPEQVNRLADLADAAAQAGGSRPNSGSRR